MLRRFWKKETDTPIGREKAAVLARMKDVGVGSPEYPKMLTYLERLSDVEDKGRRTPVSWDTIASIGGNFAIAFTVILWEQNHLAVSKGWSHLVPPKRLK
jgi:hypothetical protein